MAFCMADMVGFVENDIHQCRMCPLDIFDCTFGCCRILRFIRNVFIVAQCQRIAYIPDSRPFTNTADFGFRIRFAQQTEYSRENTVLIHHTGRQIRSLRSPFRITMKFRPRSHIHGSPVHGTGRRKDGAFFQRIRPFCHQLLHIRHIGLVHAISAPAIQPDQNYMFGFPLGSHRSIGKQQ